MNSSAPRDLAARPWLRLRLHALAAEVLPAGLATADLTRRAGWWRVGRSTETGSTDLHEPRFAKAVLLSRPFRTRVPDDFGFVTDRVTTSASLIEP